MRRYIYISIFASLATSLWSQTALYNQNVKITLKGGATLFIDGDLKQNSSMSTGQFVVLDDGTIKLTGDLINLGTTHLFKSGDQSLVEFITPGNKSIEGTGAGEINFNKVEISDNSLLILNRDISFLSDFIFTAGNVFLNGYATELRLKSGNIFGAGQVEPKIIGENGDDRFFGSSGHLQLNGLVNSALSNSYNFGNLGADFLQPGLTQLSIRRGHTAQQIGVGDGIQRYYDIFTTTPIFGNADFIFHYLEGAQSDIQGVENESDLALYRHRITALGSLDVGQVWRYQSQSNTLAGANTSSLSNLDSLLSYRWSMQECQRPNVNIIASATDGCTGETLTLDAGSGTGWSYLWNNGATTQSIDISSSNAQSEKYFVVVSNSQACSNMDSIEITWIEQPTINFDQNPENVCEGTSLTLDPIATGINLSYQWSNGSTDPTIDHMSDGMGTTNYDLTVTSDRLCSTSATIQVNDLPAPPIDLGPGQGICDGQPIMIGEDLGTGFSYLWSNGSNQARILIGSSGDYDVLVTNTTTGCAASDTINVVFSGLNIQEVVQDLSCPDSNDGAISLNIFGGQSPFTYQWSNGAVSAFIAGLASGSFQVTVTDDVNCVDTIDNIWVDKPDSLVTMPDITSDLCHELSGQIILNPDGGTHPYQFSWYDDQLNVIGNSQDIKDLTPSTYSVEMQDANGCMLTREIVVPGPTQPMNLEISLANTTCALNDGAINVTPTGGTAPYTYHWSNGSTNPSIEQLFPGQYSVEVEDVNGCLKSAGPFQVRSPSAISVSVDSVVQISCFGLRDGGIFLNIDNPDQANLDIDWSTGGRTSSLRNLGAGMYHVKIQNLDGCEVIRDTFEISEPLPLSIDAMLINIACVEDRGAIFTEVEGGTMPYSYLWSTGSDQPHIDQLDPGNYHLTVEDSNGCRTDSSFNLLSPIPLKLVLIPRKDKVCPGAADGELIVDVQGGQPGYDIEWSHGARGEKVSDLAAGIYSIQVVDQVGCTSGATYEVQSLDEMKVDALVQHPSGEGQEDASISLSIQGGQSPYEFLWSTGEPSQDLQQIGDGIYQVVITDANACTKTEAFEVIDPNSLVSEIIVKDVTCAGYADGRISITISGGSEPYRYNWNTADSTKIITDLAAANYQLTISDAVGNRLVENVTVGSPEAIQVEAAVSNVSCFGAQDGAIDLMINGNHGPYNVVWSDDDSITQREFLNAGEYSVSVTDTLGCSRHKNYQIETPEAIIIIADLIHPSVANGTDGAIEVAVQSGLDSLTFFWSTGETSQNLTGLSAGQYIISITDGQSCEKVDTFVLRDPSNLSIETEVDSVTCHGFSDGQISLSITGGQTPYSVQWAHGPAESRLSNLLAGTYEVQIKDATGLTENRSFVLAEPASIDLEVIAMEHLKCFGDRSGRIAIDGSGGTGVLSFLWSHGPTTSELLNVPAGMYSLIIKDEDGCQLDTVFELDQPDPIMTDIAIENAGCDGGFNGSATVVVSGGSPDYNFAWSNGRLGPTIDHLPPGVLTLSVEDKLGCQVSDTVVIAESLGFELQGVVQDKPCTDSGAGGSIKLSTEGGGSPFSFRWSDGAENQSQSNLDVGIYQVTVTDAEGCQVTDEFEIKGAEPLVVNLRTSGVGCVAGQGGAIVAKAEGGQLPYQYQWSNGSINGQIANLTDGIYNVRVIDSLGCFVEATATVERSTETLNARFLAASPVLAEQSVQFLDVSSPKPSTWFWDFGYDVNSTSSIEDPKYTYPSKKGEAVSIYQVDLSISSAQCQSSTQKLIRVQNQKLIADAGKAKPKFLLTEIQQLNVFPNPVNDQFEIEIVLSKEAAVDIHFFTIDGRLLQKHQLSGNSIYLKKIEVSALPVGNYFLHIRVGKIIQTKKILIVH